MTAHVEPKPRRVRIVHAVIAVLLVGLAMWMTVAIVPQLLTSNAGWMDWLALLFPALSAALGLFIYFSPYCPSGGFMRHRSGSARFFGGYFGVLLFAEFAYAHLAHQDSIRGVVGGVAISGLAVLMLWAFYGAINNHVDQQSDGRNPPA
jgi:hypothetical protein